MTIDEQHVRVELGLQKIASNQFDNIQEQEIDLALNIAQDRFVKLRVFPKGPVDAQRRLDDIKELLVKNKRLDAYVLRVDDSSYEESTVYARLPEDYLFLVADRSQVTSRKEGDCVKRPKATLEKRVSNICVLPFVRSTRTECPYYRQVVLNVQALSQQNAQLPVVLFDVADTIYKNGSDAPEDRFELINHMLDVLNSNTLGITVYWEKYQDLVQSNSFILVYASDGVTTYLQATLVVDSASSVAGFREHVDYVYKLEDDWTKEYRVNRLTEPEALYSMLRHPFGKTRRNSPLSTLSQGRLYLYEGDDFIIAGAMIDYIRQPARMSKPEGISCEMSEHVHQEIVDLAIEYLQLSTANPMYQLKAADDERRNS